MKEQFSCVTKSYKLGWSMHKKFSFITTNWVNFPKYHRIYRTPIYLFIKYFSKKISTGAVCFGGLQPLPPKNSFSELLRFCLSVSRFESHQCQPGSMSNSWIFQAIMWSSFVILCGMCMCVCMFTTAIFYNQKWYLKALFPQSLARDAWKKVTLLK